MGNQTFLFDGKVKIPKTKNNPMWLPWGKLEKTCGDCVFLKKQSDLLQGSKEYRKKIFTCLKWRSQVFSTYRNRIFRKKFQACSLFKEKK